MPLQFKFKKFGAPRSVPTEQATGTTPALVLSLGGNFLLAGVFLRALLNPVAHVGFIFSYDNTIDTYWNIKLPETR